MLMVIFGAGASYDSSPTYPPGTYSVVAEANAPGSAATILHRPLRKSKAMEAEIAAEEAEMNPY